MTNPFAPQEPNNRYGEMFNELIEQAGEIAQLKSEIERLEAEVADCHRQRDEAQFWKSEHLRIYDYNRFGTIAFSGLPEQLPEPDVLRNLANERKRFTLVMYLEDYQTPSDVEVTARPRR